MNLTIPLLFIIANIAANVGLTINDIKQLNDPSKNIAFIVLLGVVILVSLIVGGMTLMYISKSKNVKYMVRYLICLTVLFAMYGTSLGALVGINKKNDEIDNDYDTDIYAFVSWIVITMIFLSWVGVIFANYKSSNERMF